MSKFEEYANKYQHVKMERRDAILQFTLHTNGGPVIWDFQAHSDTAHALGDVARDRDNKVIILTGSGDDFIAELLWSQWPTRFVFGGEQHPQEVIACRLLSPSRDNRLNERIKGVHDTTKLSRTRRWQTGSCRHSPPYTSQRNSIRSSRRP